MNCTIICSHNISNKTWIETQLIDCFYEIIEPEQIYIPVMERRSMSAIDGNGIIKYLLQAKYKLKEFTASWAEFGIEAISKRNIEMLQSSQFLLALNDNNDRAVNNCIQIATRLGIDMNIRYLTKYEKIQLR